MATKLSMCLTWMKTILLESQLQKTVGTEPVMFHHIIQFYLAVGLFTQSKTSALDNKNMTTSFFLILWITLQDWDFGLQFTYC